MSTPTTSIAIGGGPDGLIALAEIRPGDRVFELAALLWAGIEHKPWMTCIGMAANERHGTTRREWHAWRVPAFLILRPRLRPAGRGAPRRKPPPSGKRTR